MYRLLIYTCLGDERWRNVVGPLVNSSIEETVAPVRLEFDSEEDMRSCARRVSDRLAAVDDDEPWPSFVVELNGEAVAMVNSLSDAIALLVSKLNVESCDMPLGDVIGFWSSDDAYFLDYDTRNMSLMAVVIDRCSGQVLWRPYAVAVDCRPESYERVRIPLSTLSRA